jgi:transcription initiation factor IIF auxiliary subunit
MLILSNRSDPSPMEGYPMRSWSIEVWLLDDQGNEYMPNVFEKAVYNLHPTFPNPRQSECDMGGLRTSVER